VVILGYARIITLLPGCPLGKAVGDQFDLHVLSLKNVGGYSYLNFSIEPFLRMIKKKEEQGRLSKYHDFVNIKSWIVQFIENGQDHLAGVCRIELT
jgi:hypothetical protein